MGLNLLLVGFGLQHFGFHLATRTIDARRIVLTDPAGHQLAVIGVDNDWDDLPSKTYYPGIEFRDEKGEPKMVLFGTEIHFNEGQQSANLGFTGLDISDKGTSILANGNTLAYSGSKGQLMLFPSDSGLDLSLATGEDSFGVNTGNNQASMYVAGRNGELDITADESGTRIQRYAKVQLR